jgi:flagellar motor switch protein FliN
MAKKQETAKQLRDDSDVGLDRAINDLRGVLSKDAEGLNTPDDDARAGDSMMAGSEKAKALDSDFGADFAMDDFPAAADGEDALDAMFPASPAFDDEPVAALAAPDTIGAHIPDTVPESAFARGRSTPPADAPANLDIIMDIPIDMEIVLGTSRLPVSGLMSLTEGSLIALDRKIGEPVEIMVNGRLFGRGEITVLEGDDTRFGVKLIEIIGQIGK